MLFNPVAFGANRDDVFDALGAIAPEVDAERVDLAQAVVDVHRLVPGGLQVGTVRRWHLHPVRGIC